MKISQLNSNSVLGIPNEELLSLHRRVHQLFAKNFRGNRLERVGNLRRADLINAHTLLAVELRERGFEHRQPVRMLKAQRSVLQAGALAPRLFTRGVRLLVSAERRAFPVREPLVVLHGPLALGEIHLTEPFEFALREFDGLRHLHGLKAPPLKGGRGKLYGFGVVIRSRYQKPMKLNLEPRTVIEL